MARINLQAIGTTGLKRSGGYVHEEYLPELRGVRGRQVYREMSEQSSLLGGILFAIEMMIRAAEWSIQPGSDHETDVDQAEFVQTCLDDMETPFKEELSEILTELIYGFAPLEVLYKWRHGDNPGDPTRHSAYDDGLIGWRDWSIRAQESIQEWIFDQEGHAIGFIQQAEPDFMRREVPLSKCMLFRTTSRKNNPEGISALRSCYRDWYFIRHLETIEGIGAERDLAGLPVIYVPSELLAPDATDDEKAILDHCQKLVTSIRRDEQEGLVMPGDVDQESGKALYRIELLSTGGQRQFDTDRIIRRKETRMAAALLADFVLLGHEGRGSYALSSDKTAMFGFALGAWMDGIGAIVNPHIKTLLRLNGMRWAVAPPYLHHGDVETVDPKVWGEFLQNLAAAGGPLTPEVFEHIYRKVGLPVPEGGLGMEDSGAARPRKPALTLPQDEVEE
ncbi:MAG: hypothetical protein ACM3US_09870 [Sphingomonadaceae bacterium]